MPEQSLNLLIEYNQARLDEECDCGGSGDAKALRKEASFLDLANKLATHEQIICQLLPMLAKPELSVEQKQMLFYLLLRGDDEALQKQALETHLSEQPPPFDILPALALLDTEKQQQAIANLAQLPTLAARKTLAAHFLVNSGGENHIVLFLDANTGHALYQGDVFDTFIARFGTPQARQDLVNRLSAEQGEQKTALAKALLCAGSTEALNYLCTGEGLLNDRCHSFALLSGPKDWEQLKPIIEQSQDESVLLAVAKQLKWYGNPQSIALLRKGTEHENPKVQQAFHRLLMAFFDEDDGTVFEGFLLQEDEARNQKNYAARLKTFWTAKTITLTQQLSQQRYCQSEIFNLNALFEDYIGTRNHYNLSEHTAFSQFVGYLSLWTGQSFYYDQHALVSKQCQQVKQMKDWLEANCFEPGGFLCFGRTLG